MKTTKALLGILTIAVCLAFGQQLQAASFLTTGALTKARYYHTATLLTNGLVLVVGGNGDNSERLSSAELYNPATGMWTTTGTMTATRMQHTATLLTNGLVLVVGGYGGGVYRASAELYNPATETWTATGSLNEARVVHAATLLPNGLVLVAGGQSPSFLASAELYNPVTGTWTFTGTMTTTRFVHTMTLLPNGKVLVAGGRSGGGDTDLSSAELYNPAIGTWTATAGMTNARANHTATLLPNGKVLVAGGDIKPVASPAALASAELYDPATETWTLTGSMNTARTDSTETLLRNGLVLVVGGNPVAGGGYIPLSSAELYNPATKTWTATSDLNAARYLPTATLLPNGRVLVAGGGYAQARSLSSTELYVPDPRVDLIKAVKPSFSGLVLATDYQLQVSADMNNWTNQGSAFTATNISMVYPQYWDVDNWNSLFFRLQVTP